jgi:uncharacterized repeat protein (TIGR01451 family)
MAGLVAAVATLAGAGLVHAGVPPVAEPGPVLPEPTPIVPPLPAPPPGPPECKDPPTPVVAIRVRVPACAPVGKDLKYHICVENRSPAPAHHVLVRDAVPANAKFVRADPPPHATAPELRWELGTLRPSDTREIVLILKPLGKGSVKNCARVQFEHGECVCTKVGPPGPVFRSTRPDRPELELVKKGPAQAAPGSTLTYELTVTNTGGADMTGIKLTDTLPDGLEHAGGKKTLTWDVERLSPGQSRAIEYKVTAKKQGRLCNEAEATAAGGLRKKARHCVRIGDAKITLTKTGPRRQYLNIPATYFLTVKNPGALPLEDVTLTDPLPEGTAFVRASNGGELTGSEVRWRIDTLAAGQSRTVQLTLRARAAGKVTNRATATAGPGISATAEVVTDFQGVSALLAELVDTVDPVEVEGETAYVITLRNQGMVPVTNVRITAIIPTELALIRARGPVDNRLGRRVDGGQELVFEPLAALAPGAAVRYEVFVKARQAGDARFKMDVMADQLKAGGPVHLEESTTVYSDVAP